METVVKKVRKNGKCKFRYRSMLRGKQHVILSKESKLMSDYEHAAEGTGLRRLIIYGNSENEKKYILKFNQLINFNYNERVEQNGLTIIANGNGSVTISGKCTAYTTYSLSNSNYVEGHVYFVKSGIKNGLVAPSTSNQPFFFVNYGYMQKEAEEGVIFTADKTSKIYNLLYVGPGREFTEPVTLYPMCIDLTEMYGAGYEPINSYAFESLYPENFYPYTACELHYIKKDLIVSSAYVTPSEEYPKEIESCGEENSAVYLSCMNPKFLACAKSVSLKKVGDSTDRLIIDGVSGRVKVERKVGVIQSYNGEEVGDTYLSTTGALTYGAKVYYPLTAPVEEDVTNTEDGRSLLSVLNLTGSVSLVITCEPVGKVVSLGKIRTEYWKMIK